MAPRVSSGLTLANVSQVTSGYFMCLVTAGDNPFLEDYDTKHVTVAGRWRLGSDNSRYTQLLSYVLNDELCFYDMDYVPKKRTMFERPG